MMDEWPPMKDLDLNTPPTRDEKNLAMLAHLLPLLGVLMPGLNAAIPLVIWLLKRNQSVYLDHHAREALNFQILVLLMLVFFWVVLKLFLINLIFSMLVPIVVILTLMLMIRAGLKASGGHYYRYPFSVRLVA